MLPQTHSSPNHLGAHVVLVLMVVQLDQILVTGTTSCSELCHYVPWARDADCSRRHLEQVPIECIGSKALNLNRNNITIVPSGVFSGFQKLKYLQMLENNIQKVSANAFAGAHRLKSINLVQNYLTILPLATFNDTVELRWVYLSKNKITSIESGVFQDSPLIQILYLDNNDLHTLQFDVFRGLTTLQRLLLGDNKLQSLPDGVFSDMGELNYLDLSRNGLQTLPADTFVGLDKLKTVKLSGNRLVTLPPETFSHNLVTMLDISGNNLKTLSWMESDFESFEEIEGAGNSWECDCSLEPFRVTMVRLSRGLDSTVICAGPPPLAHTDIVTHTTLCSDSSSTAKTTTLKNIYMMREDVQSTNAVVQRDNDDGALKITLYAVSSFTVIAIVCMGLYIFVVYIIPWRQENEKSNVGIQATSKEIKIVNKQNKIENPYQV